METELIASVETGLSASWSERTQSRKAMETPTSSVLPRIHLVSERTQSRKAMETHSDRSLHRDRLVPKGLRAERQWRLRLDVKLPHGNGLVTKATRAERQWRLEPPCHRRTHVFGSSRRRLSRKAMETRRCWKRRRPQAGSRRRLSRKAMETEKHELAFSLGANVREGD